MSTLLAGCEEERIRSHIVMERDQSDAKQAAMAANEKAQTIETGWCRTMSPA